MPYYRWRGVKLNASYCKGIFFARDPDALRERLSLLDVALISYSERKPIHILPVSAEQRYLFFQQLHALLHAGVHVWSALQILAEQMSDTRVADISLQLADHVHQGKSLHESMETCSLFSSEMIHVVRVGAQSDNLPVALHMLCEHLHATAAFKKQVRSVLLLPMCTLAIFFVVLAIVLTVIVPKYADLFASTSNELPAATRILLRMNAFVSSYYFLGTLFIAITMITVMYRAMKRPAIKIICDKHMLRVPFLGSLIKNISQVCYLRSLALLLQGGMPLVAALSASKQAIANDHVQAALNDCIESVQAGRDMSYAMQLHTELFSRDLISLITVGEETGNLPEMISRAAGLSAERVRCLLQRFTYSVQPVVMIVLGLLVAALICAVYIPLFNLADLAIA